LEGTVIDNPEDLEPDSEDTPNDYDADPTDPDIRIRPSDDTLRDPVKVRRSP
jgi:hypothetical protein